MRLQWTLVTEGVAGGPLGQAMYGNAGSTWPPVPPARSGLGDLAIHNIKTLTALAGRGRGAHAASTPGSPPREVGGARLTGIDPDVSHLMVRHRIGAMSTIFASHVVLSYLGTAVQLYGPSGTPNLLGDDWDLVGIEVFRADWGHWRSYASPDRTWNWTDGLREAVLALANGSPPAVDLEHDIHVVDVLGAAARSAADDGRPVPVSTEFGPLALTYDFDPAFAVIHDHPPMGGQ